MVKPLCLLLLVGILCIYPKVSARAVTNVDSPLTGDTVDSTTRTDAGSAETPDDLNEINIANQVTITYEDSNGQLAGPLRIFLTLTLITIAPMLIIMLTSFTRVIIVLHFTRTALSTQTAPPNQILIGISLFLTFFIMQPTFTAVYQDAIIPFEEGQIEQEEFVETAIGPFRTFMYGQTERKDVLLFMEIAGEEWDGVLDNIPTTVLIPAFIISELRTAFIIGFLIYIPFIIIDMVVASALMSMGMMMLPPTTISMPFKILLFVLADGWNLVIAGVVKTFY
ncbi:MAG: flagellar type III secretion system pore protein FliP [Lachnospiraceae bacterium]|nr:flagellar type III secretion system pore protein FliP [Lachnospiraceae bacterium]